MASMEKGGFRPPPLGNVLWKCPNCGSFNAANDDFCKKCNGPKEVDETIAGATFAPLKESERKLKKN